MSKLVKDNMSDLLSFTETQKLLDSISTDHKKLVKDVIPEAIGVQDLQTILQNLLKEHVSIKDLPSILEAVLQKNQNNLMLKN